jgi:hypothetical protein
MGELASKISQSPNYQALKGAVPSTPYDFKKALISSFPKLASKFGASDSDISDAREWQQSRTADVQANMPILNAVGSTAEGMLNGASMGGLEAAQKVAGDTTSQQDTDFLKKNFGIENTAGNIAGAVASSLAIPGGGEALAAKGGFLAGKGLIPLVARQALNAATFAIPTAAFQSINTGDPSQTWNDLKQNMIYGTVGGVALSKILGGAPAVAKAMDEVANDMAINSAIPGASRILKNVAAGGVAGKAGSTAEHLADLKSNLSDMILKNNLFSKSDVEAFTQGNGKIWNQVDDAFKNSEAKPSDFLNEIVNHPDIQKLLNDPVYGQGIGNYIQEVVQRGDSYVAGQKLTGDSALPDIRKMLTKDMSNGFKSSDVPTQLNGEVADHIHDILDGHFVPAELKQSWPAMKMLKLGSARAESTVKGVEAGSPTAPREILSKILGGAGEGAAIGGASSLKNFDPSDPASWANLGVNMTLGTVVGSMANKGLARLANRMGGKTAGFIKGLSSATATIPGGAGELIGSKAAQMIGTGQLNGVAPAIGGIVSPRMPTVPSDTPVGTEPPQNAPVEQGSPTVNPIPISPVTGQPQGPSGAQPIPNATAQPPEPSPIDLQQKANSDFIGETQNASGHAFAPKLLEQRLQMMYELHQRRLQGFAEPYEQFVQAVKQGTDNFNPENPATWQGLVDDPAQAEKLYKAHMALKKMDGPNVISNALNHYTDNLFNSGIGGAGRLSSSDRMAHDADNEKLISALKGMGVGDTKEIDTRLKQIMWDKSKNSEQKKQAVLDMIVNEGGVDLTKLMQMGLWK